MRASGVAVKLRVPRPIRLAPAVADLGGDAIRAEGGAGREGHLRYRCAV